MDPFYNVRFTDGSTFAYRGDRESTIAEIERFSPGESVNYDRFMALSEEICRIGFKQLGDAPFNSVMDRVRVTPDILCLQGLRSVHGFVARYFKDPRLRFIFSFHPLFIGGNPFKASAVFAIDLLSGENFRRLVAGWGHGGSGRGPRQADRRAGRFHQIRGRGQTDNHC